MEDVLNKNKYKKKKKKGNGEVDKNVLRNRPESKSCGQKANIRKGDFIKGNEIFSELTEVTALQKLGHIMEQEMVNRFNILQEMTAANDELSGATSQTNTTKFTQKPSSHTSNDKTSEQMNGQSDQDKSSGPLTGQTSKDESSQLLTGLTSGGKSSEQLKQGLGASEREALLVLRPDLVVPELRDLPTLGDMLTVPTTLTQATRIIFALRKDMLILRNSMLKQALVNSAEHIEMLRKRRNDKQERLLKQLNKLFSRPQLAFMREGEKVEPWTLEDYLKSISLRLVCCHSAFEHVRNTMQIPLPSMFAVRSMANCGIMPEVAIRYKELAEAKDLSESFNLPTKKNAQLAGGAVDTPITREGRGGGGASGVSKRKRTDDEEGSDPLQLSPRRVGWNASGLEMRAEPSWSSDETGSDRSDHAPSLERARGRGNGQGRGRSRGQQRAGRSGLGTKLTGGKRGPRERAESTSRGDAGYPSESEGSDAEGVSFSREAPSHFNRQRDHAGWVSANRGWRDDPHPSPVLDWESPPRSSLKKKGAGRKTHRYRV